MLRRDGSAVALFWTGPAGGSAGWLRAAARDPLRAWGRRLRISRVRAGGARVPALK